MQEKSHLLFTLKQNYLKKLEIYKKQKKTNQSKKQDYYQSVVSLALKDAELKYQRQILLNQDIDWNNLFNEQLLYINDTRTNLQTILQNYRQLRQQISQFQHLFQFTTEDTRIHTLNSIVFCNYSKSIINNEIRKNYLLNKLFQQKKEMILSYNFYQEQLNVMKKQLKEYQINKINIFRRYERIYVGKSKELLEQQQFLATSSFQYQYFGGGNLGMNESDHSSDNDDNNNHHISSFTGGFHSRPNPPSRPIHSRPSMKRKSIKSRKTATDANNPATPFVPYGPTSTSTPSFPNPFAIDNYSSQLSLLPAEEQQKIQAQQQQQQEHQQQQELQQKETLSTSLMYQLMNSLDDNDDEDEENIVYNKDSLEHRVARKILIMDMPELIAMNNNNNNKGDHIGINAMSDDSLGMIEDLHLPSLKNDLKSSKGKGRGKKGGKGEDLPITNDNNTIPNIGRNRRLSIVQHGDFIQFVDRFNKSRYQSNASSMIDNINYKNNKNNDDNTSSPNKSNSSSIHKNKNNNDFSITEKSSILSFPEYPSNKKKKNKKTTKKSSSEQTNPIIIYDPQAFAESCSGDYIRPNTILDVNKGIGDREERLITLVDHCCIAKGKVKQLTAIKEGLNRELMKQACILLSIISDYTNTKSNSTNTVADQMKLQSILQSSQIKDILGFFQASPHHQRLHFDRREKEKSIEEMKKKMTELLYSTTKGM